MTIPTIPRSSPERRTLKLLLWLLLATGLGGAFLQFRGTPICHYLGLSLPNLSSGFVWTLLTYPFCYPASNFFDLLFRLGVDLVLLYFFGSPLIDRLGAKRFLTLFFGAVFLGGLAASASLFAFHGYFFSGPSPALLGLYTAWAILHSSQDSPSPLTHFPWIVALLIGGSLLLDLMAGQWIVFFADLAGVLFGYGFCIIGEKAESFRFLRSFEHAIHAGLEKRHKTQKLSPGPKVVDFRTGQPVLDDDQFMDAMLARISQYGDGILTPAEKNRMRQISERKANKKH